MQEVLDQPYTPIRKLFANISNWKVKARVTNKSDLRTFNKQGEEIEYFSIDIMDEEDSEINCTFFN